MAQPFIGTRENNHPMVARSMVMDNGNGYR
jgi:hypothetical protein